MSRSGKTSVIFLVVISVLLLSLSAITLFFYQQESEKRKAAENELAQTKAAQAKTGADLKKAQEQIYLLEAKAKEADDRIESLLQTLDIEKGVKEEVQKENIALKDDLAKEIQGKESIQSELRAAQDKVASLEQSLTAQEKLRGELEGKVKEMEQKAAAEQQEVQLEKIVVAPGEIPPGKVLSVNAENNFLVFDLGQEQGISEGMMMSAYRGEKYLGDIKVSRVQAKMSVADFVAPLTAKEVRENDRIMVKK